MKPELDQKLCEEFPNLYQDRYTNPQTSCMAFGFPGDGWFNLLYDLSVKLEELILQYPEDLPEGTTGSIRSDFKASQVKEKFGGLRYYMSHSTAEMEALIDEAEAIAAVTCERCGAEGKARSGGWIQTLCDTCYSERHKKK